MSKTLEETLREPAPVVVAEGVALHARKVALRRLNAVVKVYAGALQHIVALHEGVPEDEGVLVEALAAILADQVADGDEAVTAWFMALSDATPEALLDLDYDQFQELVGAIYAANRGPFGMRNALFRRHLELAVERDETPTSLPASTE